MKITPAVTRCKCAFWRTQNRAHRHKELTLELEAKGYDWILKA